MPLRPTSSEVSSHYFYQDLAHGIRMICAKIAELIESVFAHLENAKVNKKIHQLDQQVTNLRNTRNNETDPDKRNNVHEEVLATKNTIWAMKISRAFKIAEEKEVDQTKLDRVVKAVEENPRDFIPALEALPEEIRQAWGLITQCGILSKLPTDLSSEQEISDILKKNDANRDTKQLVIDFFKVLKK